MPRVTWEGWVVVGITLGVLVALATGKVAADVALVGAVVLMVLIDLAVPGANILSTKDALGGMANEGMITVAIMYVVVCGLRETGGIAWIGRRLLGHPRTLLGAQLRLTGQSMLLSAFMNNTPLVAMFIPVVQDWCKRLGISASKMMIPLSFATVLGGTCTIIGTSTNLIVSGLWSSHFKDRPIGFFDIAWVGVPSAILGGLVLIVMTRWFLPDRKPVLNIGGDARSYTVEMEVDPAAGLVGQTIAQAGLRNLPSLYLAEIDRAGVFLPAVGPDEKLMAGDRLVFVGVVDSVVELQKIRGLRPATNQVVKLDAPRPQRSLVEAVVSRTNPLIGKTVKEGRFRSVFNAVVIAVARDGHRITDKKIGDIELQAGDTLLLEAHRSFQEQYKNSREWLLLSAVQDSTPMRHERAIMAVAILIGMVLLAVFGERWGVSMIHAAALAAGLMLMTRCCSGSQARSSVDWQVLIAIAGGFGLGKAMETSGAAGVIAERLIALAQGNAWVTLGMVYLVTMLLSEILTNNAAAMLVFPIAIGAAEKVGADPLPFAINIMMAASACFMTPIGYQTHMMVMGPGGYRFADFTRVGFPLNFAVMAVTVGLTPLIWPLLPK
jgi:di/tricarboxylate transporter